MAIIVSRLVIGTFVVLSIAFGLLIAWPLVAIVFAIVLVVKTVDYREKLASSKRLPVGALDDTPQVSSPPLVERSSRA